MKKGNELQYIIFCPSAVIPWRCSFRMQLRSVRGSLMSKNNGLACFYKRATKHRRSPLFTHSSDLPLNTLSIAA